jgi:tetratricopeptide (TPR) repeat protein
LGNYDEGIRLQREALQETNVFEHYLGISYECAGMRDSALAVAKRLEGYSTQWFNFGLAELWAVLGDEEKAMQYVEKAFEQRQDFVVWFDRDYFLKSLWKNPRFIEIHNSFVLP